MNILVIGSGGREHAIIKSISKSKKCSKIYALPGNGGTESLADNIEGSQVEIIENCGHMILLEEAGKSLGILKKFIRKHHPKE